MRRRRVRAAIRRRARSDRTGPCVDGRRLIDGDHAVDGGRQAGDRTDDAGRVVAALATTSSFQPSTSSAVRDATAPRRRATDRAWSGHEPPDRDSCRCRRRYGVGVVSVSLMRCSGSVGERLGASTCGRWPTPGMTTTVPRRSSAARSAASWRGAGDRSPDGDHDRGRRRRRRAAPRSWRSTEPPHRPAPARRDRPMPARRRRAPPSSRRRRGRRRSRRRSTPTVAGSRWPIASRAAAACTPSCKAAALDPMSGSCSNAPAITAGRRGTRRCTPSVAPPLTPTHTAGCSSRSMMSFDDQVDLSVEARDGSIRCAGSVGSRRSRRGTTRWTRRPLRRQPRAPSRGTTPGRPRRRARARRRGRRPDRPAAGW